MMKLLLLDSCVLSHDVGWVLQSIGFITDYASASLCQEEASIVTHSCVQGIRRPFVGHLEGVTSTLIFCMFTHLPRAHVKNLNYI